MNTKGLVARAVVLAVSAGVFASVVPAQAAEPGADVPHGRAVRQAPARDLGEAVRLVAPHVTRDEDGTFVVHASPALAAEVGAHRLASIEASVRRVNAMITSGELVSDTGLGVRLADGGASLRGGVNKLSFHWWGIELDLSSYWTNKLIGALNAGAGASAIAGVLAAAGVISSAAAIPAGVASGILVIGAGVIQVCSNSNGVSLYLTYTGLPWCGGQ